MCAGTSGRINQTPTDYCLLVMVSTVITSFTATGLEVPFCLLANNREVSALQWHTEMS